MGGGGLTLGMTTYNNTYIFAFKVVTVEIEPQNQPVRALLFQDFLWSWFTST